MSMTADQIRKALAPMKDFAPAILAAAEIAEAAVAADAHLADVTKKIASVDAEIKRLQSRVPKAQAESQSAQAALSVVLKQLDEANGKRDAQIQTHTAAIKQAEQAHATTLVRHQDELERVKAQITKANDDLMAVKVRLSDFKKAIPA